MNDTHPQAAHNDAEGPWLFVGGHTNGQFRTVNRSRSEWVIPVVADNGLTSGVIRCDPEVYVRRRFHLGGPTGPVVTVMVLSGLSPAVAEELLLARIAEGLAEGKW